MSARRSETTLVSHDFFRTMVIMGGSVALGCGGQAEPGDVADDVSPMPQGGVGASSGHGSAGKAAAGSVSFGSRPSTGGSGQFPASGGAAPVPAGGAPSSCPPQQLSCPAVPYCVDTGYALPNDCKCDPSRPRSAADCAPDQRFVCRMRSIGEDELRNANPVSPGFECACVSSGLSCRDACREQYRVGSDAHVDGFYTNCDTLDLPSVPAVLCGCSFIYLR